MNIRLEPHTRLRAEERGATEEEIFDTLKTGQALLAKGNRLAKFKVYLFQQVRNGRFYEEKKVEVYYLVDNNELITVTVFVLYGKF
jgi:hypothetical protein